jgi:uncharacterized protein (DUF1684 family)
MKRLIFAGLLLTLAALEGCGQSQIPMPRKTSYLDSLRAFRADYIEFHELLKTKEERDLLRFYPIDSLYRVTCSFHKYPDSPWFDMPTSSGQPKKHRKYGRLRFTIHDTTVHLVVYQSQALLQKDDTRDYLFIPFSDATSGLDTYGAGRYLECHIGDLVTGTLELDFNKAYNPYCAYVIGYNCPIPPRENELPVAIQAGEKNYGRPH